MKCRAIVRSVDSGASGLIGSDGQLLDMHPTVASTRLLPPVPIDARQSFYVQFGDWVPYLCLALLMLGIVVRPSCGT